MFVRHFLHLLECTYTVWALKQNFWISAFDQWTFGNLRFGVVTQRRFQYFEFVLVLGPDGKTLYRHRGLRAWKKVRMSK
jgi:hypothetical protein